MLEITQCGMYLKYFQRLRISRVCCSNPDIEGDECFVSICHSRAMPTHSSKRRNETIGLQQSTIESCRHRHMRDEYASIQLFSEIVYIMYREVGLSRGPCQTFTVF